MEIKHLDLHEMRCPMALLLVKRALISLAPNQHLLVDVNDTGSKKDISNYIKAQGLNVRIENFEKMTRFVINL